MQFAYYHVSYHFSSTKYVLLDRTVCHEFVCGGVSLKRHRLHREVKVLQPAVHNVLCSLSIKMCACETAVL